MGAITRSYNWEDTSLGVPETWPQSLRTTLSIILNSKFPMFLFWGQDLICFYNDAYRPSLGNQGKHPAIGMKGVALWPEIWDGIKPLIDQVMQGGEASWSEDQLLPIYRNGKLEDVYWTFSYSPVKDETGTPAGVFVTCTETTQKVLTGINLTTSLKQHQELNEEFATINEELTVTNEELTESRDELLTAYKKLETALENIKDSEERFRAMAETTDVMIALGDESGQATYFNKQWELLTGRSNDQLMEFGWVDLMHPDDKERVMAIFADALLGYKPWEWEFRLPDSSKEGYRWLLARGNPRFNTDGDFLGYISSTIDITDRKRDDERKNDFIGMVSHELKTPLTSLNANLQMMQLKAKKTDDEFIQIGLERAVKQTKKMTTMINGFLNVSRLEAGKIHIDNQRFDMKELVKEVEEEIVPLITTHKIVFAPVLTTWVIGDKDKIGQVISNFISNALKYSPPGTSVQIACIVKDGCSQVSVSDEGIGIAKTDLNKLFDRYYRVEGHQMPTVSGFGIGLYICSEIVQRHEGKIWVESEVDKGSTFYFSIPVVV